MTRSEVVRAIANKTNLSQAEARDALDAFVDVLKMAADDNEDVTISGFGRFTVRDRPPTQRRKPGTNEIVDVPRRKTITFKASRLFRNQI
jgi:nucleoid DNA-binding protein